MMHVLFHADGTYLLGEDDSELLRVFNPRVGTISPEPLAFGCITAHMPDHDWQEFKGSAESEKAIIQKAEAATKAREG